MYMYVSPDECSFVRSCDGGGGDYQIHNGTKHGHDDNRALEEMKKRTRTGAGNIFHAITARAAAAAAAAVVVVELHFHISRQKR